MSTRSTRTAGTTDTAGIAQPRLGARGWARWAWRQLTSMRTALLLLMLLAIAAVPGSVWPQRSIDAARVATYLEEHPGVGPWMDRAGLFDVYASPWFAAIYLLLLLSLLGCIVPRLRVHARALQQPPPPVPRRLSRLPAHATLTTDASPAEALDVVRARWRRGMRLRADEGTGVSAESGYARESGNLLFHIAFVVLILAVGLGHLLGWRGEVIVPERTAFANTVSRYDTMSPGPWVDTTRLDPFWVRVDKVDVSFETKAGGAQFGAPRDFVATATTQRGDEPLRQQTLRVNEPLRFDDASVYLLGNGYAPVVTVRDGQGRVLYQQATPFLPRDDQYSSVGAIKVPAGGGKGDAQLGFAGFFLPTLAFDPQRGPVSRFPDLVEPALILSAWEGELFPGGRPQSVYTLDTSRMTQLRTGPGKDAEPVRLLLRPGATVDLPGGRGSVTLERVDRFAGLRVAHDPGQGLALASALTALSGLVLSLSVRRRRLFATARTLPDGRTLVELAALGKGHDPRLAQALQRHVAALAAALPGAGVGTRPATDDPLTDIPTTEPPR